MTQQEVERERKAVKECLQKTLWPFLVFTLVLTVLYIIHNL